MGNYSALKRFGQLAIANVIANLMVPLAGIVDTAFLGHLADIRHLAGVASLRLFSMWCPGALAFSG